MSALNIHDFDFPLDQELVAQRPLEQRDLSGLMVLTRSTGAVGHRAFSQLPRLLRPGDVLVVNDTRVIRARFSARRKTGGRIEGLFLRQHATGSWEVMLKNAGRCRGGQRLSLEGSDSVELELGEDLGQGRWNVRVFPPLEAVEILERVGQTPLPPYIRRADTGLEAEDRDRYQTVYAASAGAVAAPTAGLHFTAALLEELSSAGVQIVRLTLHVGPGTFLPVKVDDIAQHKMHSEWYDLPASTAEAITAARRQGRRIVAVGTTSVRVLETVAARQRTGASPQDHANPAPTWRGLEPASGWTDIFIYPPYRFQVVDALITNFHLPRSTLLMLVAAFCSPGTTDGIRMILAAYRQAVEMKYRFFSYGDAMLIE